MGCFVPVGLSVLGFLPHDIDNSQCLCQQHAKFPGHADCQGYE